MLQVAQQILLGLHFPVMFVELAPERILFTAKRFQRLLLANCGCLFDLNLSFQSLQKRLVFGNLLPFRDLRRIFLGTAGLFVLNGLFQCLDISLVILDVFFELLNGTLNTQLGIRAPSLTFSPRRASFAIFQPWVALAFFLSSGMRLFFRSSRPFSNSSASAVRGSTFALL